MDLRAAAFLTLASWASSQGIPPPPSCPADVTVLVERMLEELPSYANRVIQRSRNPRGGQAYLLLAGRPEFDPLPPPPRLERAVSSGPEAPQQVFFTTLERQVSRERATDLQSYHWLFLQPSPRGWQLVMLLSQLAAMGEGNPPLPPRDTTEGVVGQAIRLWLRDCEDS